MTKWNDWNTAEITDKASSPVKLAGKQLTTWNESNGRAASEKSRHLFHPLPNPDILYSKPNVGSVPIKDSLLNSVLPYLFVEKQRELFQILMKKKLIHLWPKPAASFTFKTCYSSTVQVNLPRGLNSTASSTTPTFIMSISHHQQRCQCAPEATGLCKHSWTNTELGVFAPLAKPWITLVWCWWRAAGAAVHYSLSVLQRHAGRGMLCSLTAPRFILPHPHSLQPLDLRGWHLMSCCCVTARSQTEQTLLLSPRESPAPLFSQFFHQLPIKARGLSSGLWALLYLWHCGGHGKTRLKPLSPQLMAIIPQS